MQTVVFTTIALISTGEAKWGIGFCPDVPKVENFDYEKFSGLWYELMRDRDHYRISNQQCTESTYKTTKKGMKLKRRYKTKWFNLGFPWYDDWFDQWTWEQIKPRKRFNEQNLDYITQTKLLFLPFQLRTLGQWRNQHYVISTDYDNYALVYGCDQWFGLFKVSYATLLSRQTTISYENQKIATNKLEEIGYNYDKLWREAGKKCEWERAKTKDQLIFEDEFASEPDWDHYTYHPDQERFKQLYTVWPGRKDVAPTDIVTGKFGEITKKRFGNDKYQMYWGEEKLQHKMNELLIGQTYKDFITLENVQYFHNIPDMFVDITLMVQTEDAEILEKLRKIEANPEDVYCCYSEGGGFRNQGYLRQYITGWGRLIAFSAEYGIESIEEGHFTEGKQDQLGRGHFMIKSIPQQYYNTEMHYTGWFPNATHNAQGIGGIDGDLKQGIWAAAEYFPDDGAVFVNEGSLTTDDTFVISNFKAMDPTSI